MAALYDDQASPARFENWIDNKYQPAANGDWIDSSDPSTGKRWALVPDGREQDIDQAGQSARRASREGPWRSMANAERARLRRKVGDLVARHAAELASLETRDNGKAIRETLPEIGAVAEMYHYWAGAADKIHGDPVRVGPASFNYTLQEPIGVVGAIIPWNSPLSLLAAKIGAALAAGNCVVVKPAEQAACSCLCFGQLFEQAGFPPGVINLVAGLGEEAGDALVRHPEVGKITFTGETATAKIITARSADTLKRLSFELGGKSPNIVFADADLDAAAAGAVAAVFTGGAGQTCIAGSRLLIERSVYDDLIERIGRIAEGIRPGDPQDPNTAMGALAFDRQFEKVRSYLDLGPTEGAEIAFGGRSGAELFEAGSPQAGGYFVEPTLFRGAHNDMRICREEIFGPVTAAIPFEDEEEAVAIANDARYGLASGVWTQDLKRAHRMVAAIESGVVWVNSYRRIHWALPFGGIKESGYGKDSGLESLRGYLQTKTVWLDLA